MALFNESQVGQLTNIVYTRSSEAWQECCCTVRDTVLFPFVELIREIVEIGALGRDMCVR